MAFSFLKGFNRTNLVSESYDYCMEFLKNSRCKDLPFHSVQHTEEVFQYVKTIAKYEEVYGNDLEPILIAALFHDTGMAETYLNHEDQSVVVMKEFLARHNYPEDKTTIAANCIMATKMPQTPQSKAEKIICDADLYHLGIESYLFKNERLRVEWENFFDMTYSDEEWYAINIDFMENQNYHTWFGKTVLKNRKDLNFKLLKERHGKYRDEI